MEFTKKEFTNLRADLDKAFAEIGQKYNINLSIGGITYNPYEFSAKLKGEKLDEDIRRKKFEELCGDYGFKKEDFEKDFTANGKVFHLTGFNPKAPKNPCIIYCVTEKKEYIGPVGWVKMYL
jgi:hypothetical protein